MGTHAARFLIALAATLPALAGAYDHHDPASLAARVREMAAAGELASARILQARAERIAPGDARVALSREALEAASAGRAVPPAGTPPVASSPAPPAEGAPRKPGAVPPPPPAPWRLP